MQPATKKPIKTIKCVVICKDDEGYRSLFPVIVQYRDGDQLNSSLHYEAAEKEASRLGYNPVITIDELDRGRRITSLFFWTTDPESEDPVAITSVAEERKL